MEFRRLCELVRLHHLTNFKFANPEQRATLLSNADSFNRFMETRFKQLQVTALPIASGALIPIKIEHHPFH